MKAEITEFSGPLLGFPSFSEGFRLRLNKVNPIQKATDIINYLIETFGKEERVTDEGKYLILEGSGWAVSRGLVRRTNPFSKPKEVTDSYTMFIILDDIVKVDTVLKGLSLECDKIDKSQTLDYNVNKALSKVKSKLTDREIRRIQTMVSICVRNFGYAVQWYDVHVDAQSKTVSFNTEEGSPVRTYRFS